MDLLKVICVHVSIRVYAYTYIHTREKDFLKNNYGNLNMK